MNFHDFAGSTVVHSIGGWVAIAGAIMLGPRLGRKFKRDGGGPMPPHDLTIAVIGGLILWFGWYGFNPCSTLSIMDNAGVGRVATNTTLAACTGRPGRDLRDVAQDEEVGHDGHHQRLPRRPGGDHLPLLLGQQRSAPAPSAPWRACWSSWRWSCSSILRIDDPVGAWPVHGVCGIWGTLSLGLFASGEYSAAGSSPFGMPSIVAKSPEALTGLFYGGGTKRPRGAVRRRA